MTLLAALNTYLQGLGITGPFFVGEILDPKAKTATLSFMVGNSDEDPTRTHSFPTVQIFFRRPTQAAVHLEAWIAYRALNTLRPISLTDTYRVARGRCPSHPVSLGRDPVGLWRYSLDVEFLTGYQTAI